MFIQLSVPDTTPATTAGMGSIVPGGGPLQEEKCYIGAMSLTTTTNLDNALLQSMAQRIAEQLHPEEIILFGSAARGDTHARSDVDLLVVMPEWEEVRKRRWELQARAKKALSMADPPVDILLYTRLEFEHWKCVRNHVVHNGIRDGRRLYKAETLPDLTTLPQRKYTLESEMHQLLYATSLREIRALKGMMSPENFDDEIFGLHAQQAVEKLLKAWISSLDKDFQLTHDINKLLQALAGANQDVLPCWELVGLTPFAGPVRYLEEKKEVVALNRPELVEQIEALRVRVARITGIAEQGQ